MATSEWYRMTTLGEFCDAVMHCENCEPSGDCDSCDTIDGRWMEAVAEYAQSCDQCGELHCNDNLIVDEATDLGYCPECYETRKQLLVDKVAAIIHDLDSLHSVFLCYDYRIDAIKECNHGDVEYVRLSDIAALVKKHKHVW